MKKFLILLTIVLIICQASALASDGGLTFGKSDLMLTENAFNYLPATIEVTIKLPTSVTGRGGVILGTYTKSAVPAFNLEVYEKGVPRMYYVVGSSASAKVDAQFSSIKVNTGEWIHLTIVNDRANSECRCYINGELKETISATYPAHKEVTAKLAVGGDQREGSAYYFKGSIKSIRLYNDIRTPEEIKSDYTSQPLDKSDLIVAYNLDTNSDGSRPSVLEDISENGYDAYHSSYYFTDDVEEPKDYSYSMAVVGDTSVAVKSNPGSFNKIYDWVIKNAEDKNIKFLFGLGDMTQDGYPQYALADANFMLLNEKVPFSFVRGEKDKKFDEIFTLKRYSDEISGSYDATMKNTYRKFEAGQLKYLALSLDTDATDDVIAWANKVCQDNPDRNVIVTTHAYMDASGKTLSGTASTSVGKNVGANLWNKLIKLNKNITLVLCGHAESKDVVISTQKGTSGNTVTQLLVNPSLLDNTTGGSGMLAMLYFSNDGKNVQLRYMSTLENLYYGKQNQFNFTVDTISPNASADDTKTVTFMVSSDGIVSDKINTKSNYDFTVNTENTAKLTKGSLSMDVSLEKDGGKIIAVLYDKTGALVQVKTYNAKKNTKVGFETVSSGDRVKIMWWTSDKNIIPLKDVPPKFVRAYVTE